MMMCVCVIPSTLHHYDIKLFFNEVERETTAQKKKTNKKKILLEEEITIEEREFVILKKFRYLHLITYLALFE